MNSDELIGHFVQRWEICRRLDKKKRKSSGKVCNIQQFFLLVYKLAKYKIWILWNNNMESKMAFGYDKYSYKSANESVLGGKQNG